MKAKMGAATTSTSSSFSSLCYFPLSRLQSLWLKNVNHLESLPKEWLRHLISLQKLNIERCDGLDSLSWIANLKSLQYLRIWSCPNGPNLTSLPQEIHNLTSLQSLEIFCCCPLLQLRCQRQTGADWPIIAHGPLLIVFI